MGAVTGTVVAATEFAGKFKLVLVTATIASSSDTIALTEAATGIVAISGIVGAVITGGLDASFSYLQVSFSALTITVASFKASGAAADDFTGTTVSVTVLGSTSST